MEARMSPRGWKGSRSACLNFKDKIAQTHAKTWRGLVSPKGVVYAPITNLYAFCNEFGLTPNNVRLLFRGTVNSSKGWRVPTDEELTRGIPWTPASRAAFVEDAMGQVYGPIGRPEEMREVADLTGLSLIEVKMLCLGERQEIRGCRRVGG